MKYTTVTSDGKKIMYLTDLHETFINEPDSYQILKLHESSYHMKLATKSACLSWSIFSMIYVSSIYERMSEPTISLLYSDNCWLIVFHYSFDYFIKHKKNMSLFFILWNLCNISSELYALLLLLLFWKIMYRNYNIHEIY